MFDNLSASLGKVFEKLKGKGFLNEDDVNAAMREVRIALLEADVALPVVKDFINKVKENAVGEEVVKSVSPAQMVIKIVQDNLEQTLGEGAGGLNLKAAPPVVVMMVGLQGSGKTTSTAKIALLLNKQKKKSLLASLDIYRPAAQKQLETLGEQAGIDTLDIVEGEKPEKIAKRALEQAKKGGYDILFLDSAGRLHIDDELMGELVAVKKISNPTEILLVADSLTGQDAVNVAEQFHKKIEVTGIVLTRIDGDARGGAALSMRAVTGCPIKYLGIGEKLSEIEEFHPDRIASRILGMGDVVTMVEKASEAVDKKQAEKLARKMRKGQFDFNDLSSQLSGIGKMGGIGTMLGMLPGIGKIKKQIDKSGLDDSLLKQQQAIISSMTSAERVHPKLLHASRKKRIAAGSGTTVQDINRLIKMQKQMQTMMKKIGKMDKKSLLGMAAKGGFGKLLK